MLNFFSSYTYLIVNYIISSFGYIFIFKKCGMNMLYAFVPLVREYCVARCADKESDGRTLTELVAIEYILQAGLHFVKEETKLFLIVTALLFAVLIAIVVFSIRIYLGLIEVFDQKKRWIIMFIFFEGITLFYWGVSKKFVPNRTVTDYKHVKGAKVSGIKAQTLENGLTVNIKNRTVWDFVKRRVLLKDIHMSIPKGHMVLLLGGSGAGKTTYLNAITGYEKAKAKVELDGQDVYKEYGKMMYDMGFVPQQDLVRGNDTVTMTLKDAASLRLPSNISFKEKKKRVNEVLEIFGLGAVANNLVEKLSGGQRKRLSIAMEYISDPTLFILDEPDSGLDGVVARALFEKLRTIADQGKIVIVITHTPDRVIDLFDDVIVLAKDSQRTGRLAWYGPVDEAREFFGKNTMEEILLSINQKEEGGEGKADEFIEKYADRVKTAAG